MLMGYRTVTASEFFNVKSVDIRGVNRTSKDDIAKIVDAQTERTGVWNADLAELRARIEKLTFVKSAAVSRVLPNGIRVNVIEKKPEAIASLSSGNFLIDGDGQIITAVSSSDTDLPVVIKGWDEAKTEKASKENLQRVRLYQKMISQWSQFELVKRVKEVNLSDLQEPKAVIEDSGSSIAVSLSKEDVGKSLKSALEAVAGKGNKIRSVNAAGVYPVIEYMGY
jgi:cell division septal protein FtsQ